MFLKGQSVEVELLPSIYSILISVSGYMALLQIQLTFI
jgi:hypothetical protein